MQSFLSVNDADNIPQLIDLARSIKKNPLQKNLGGHLTLGLIFMNPSLRTRLSTQKAGHNLGMNVMVMNFSGEGWALETEDGVVMNGDKPEHIKEAAAVIGQYCDIIGIRSFATLSDRQKDYDEFVLKKFVQYAGVPVINMESATVHPLQSLTDLITIEEYKTRPRPKVVLTWAPHPKALPQAVANSFAQWVQKTDYEFVITHPKGYELAPEFAGKATIEYDQAAAFEGADFIYAKNWSSYTDYGKVLHQDLNWMVTEEKMKRTRNAFFMHCLPVRRNMIVDDAVLDSDRSIVIQEAGNRVYAAQAVLHSIIQSTL
ncbi:MAG: N-acetylornithine carbamoyltransferase [Cyclobacteriaceae bacterium]|nr:N-acetylornithine carbamoyltransferase [Cyclobacteriaceae bacterium]